MAAPSSESRPPVIVIGAGLAGLCCARNLREHGVAVVVAEASDAVGGRVRTDRVDGFALDRGFQVLQTAYPEAQRVLDYEALRLRAFYPGALIWNGDRFVRMADPWRRPLDGALGLFGGIGTLRDKLRVGRLRREVMTPPIDRLLSALDMSTAEFLRGRAFSDGMIEQFFRPWLSGVFLEPDLETSSRFFRFVFRMFGEGETALPADGMEAIPRQIADALPAEAIRLGTRVDRLDGDRVVLAGGETLEASAVVVATEGPEAARLLGDPVPVPGSRTTTCVYFAADRPPFREPILVLNGEGRGPVNNVVVPSNVAPEYAPQGRALVGVSIFGDGGTGETAPEDAIRGQLAGWFGEAVREWTHLRTYRIAHALPAAPAGAVEPGGHAVRVGNRRYVCGDHREQPSIQGAMASGRRAAEAVLAASDTAETPAASV